MTAPGFEGLPAGVKASRLAAMAGKNESRGVAATTARPATARGDDAAEARLRGNVAAKFSGGPGGVLRYRIWPAKRHRARLAIAVGVVVGGTAVAAYLLANVFFAGVVFLGLTFLALPFFFPTEVALDGTSLVVRQLGTPRSHDLRTFRRLEIFSVGLPRVELMTRARLSPLDPLEGILVPLPDDAATQAQVIAHLRRWVGRPPTGRFELDVDQAPEDSVDEGSATT